MSKITIITHLPLRKKGNQSLKRFIEMFLKKGHEVVLITDGHDHSGENIILHEKFKLFSLRKNEIISKKDKENESRIDFSKIKSQDELLPYVDKNFIKGIIKKQFEFLKNCLIQIRHILVINKKFRQEIDDSKIIIGYEASRSFVAKYFATKLNVPYINKYQGTVLSVCKRKVLKAILLYPKLYFGINKSNLCLMVNDGTDGLFWAVKRGNENVRFKPHGVAENDYKDIVEIQNSSDLNIIIFNNSSSSDWKRPDRIINALEKLDKNERKKIKFKTTFFGPSKKALIELVKKYDLLDCVEFIENCDHLCSNENIRNASLLIMTNDMSNLGNPILEAIYYNIPFITINDGSLVDLCDSETGGMFIDLDKNFDQNMADLIKGIIANKEILEQKKLELSLNKNVRSLEVEQEEEYNEIYKFITVEKI